MPKTLLLADDSVTIQKVVGISFASEDVLLLTVDNGDDAVARAREARPDIVLADVMMPGRDGYEVCEAIKSDPELRHVPVLLLSGTFEPFDEERARRVGADGHITKPFEAQALVDRVNELLARSEQSLAETRPPDDATAIVAAEGGDDPDAGFDFFDEENAETAPSPAIAAASARGLGDGDAFADDEPLELEAAVEDDEEPGDALLGSPGDSQPTVAMLDDAPVLRAPGGPEGPGASSDGTGPGAPFGAAGADDDVPLLGDDELDAPAPVDLGDSIEAHPDHPAPAGYEQSFDFGFEEAPAPHAEPAPAAADDPFGGALDEPLEMADAVDGGPAAAAEPAPPAAFPEPAPAGPALPPPLPAAEPPTPPPLPPAPAGGAAPAAPVELSDAMRQQLHETLEKIAWEAFGDLSERIVREALERVEAVAWEVIPQMAEALIQEEIRRLKGEDE